MKKQYMSSPEYPEAALEYMQARGWTTDITELREGAYIVAGSQESNSGSEKTLLMIVCEPESEVTSEHVEYLLKAAKQKNANAAALTANVGVTSEAQQAIEESPVSVIDADTVTGKTGTQTASSQSESVKSTTSGTKKSPTVSKKGQEMPESEIDDKYFQYAYSFFFGWLIVFLLFIFGIADFIGAQFGLMVLSIGAMFKDLRQLPSPLRGYSVWVWTILSTFLYFIIIPWYLYNRKSMSEEN